MLIEFSLNNYLSFGGSSKLSLVATSIKTGMEGTFIPPSLQWDYRLLRSAGLLGYNSAGKTNFLKAIGAMKYAVLYSAKSPDNIFVNTVTPFLLKKDNNSPSEFEIIFFLNNRKYRYGYKILNSVIEEEWLYYADPGVKEQHHFVRIRQNIEYNKRWNREVDDVIPILFKRANHHTLFLSVLGVLNVQPSVDILEWFQKLIVVENYDAEKFINLTAEFLNEDTLRYNLLHLLKVASLGFSTVVANRQSSFDKESMLSQNFMDFMIQNEILPNSKYTVQTVHDIFDSNGKLAGKINFDLRTQESAGTRKFFGLIGLLLDAITKRKILLFDELDAQFHFGMYETLISIFNSPKINPYGAQMVFTSHNTTLLKKNKIRRDQLYRIEKTIEGESKLKRMHEKSSKLRSDVSLEKEYTEGKLKVHPDIQFDLFTGLINFPEK